MPKSAKKSSRKKKIIHTIEEFGSDLTERQRLFAILYTTDKICFGNATLAYKRAYNLNDKQFNTAGVSAHRLIRNDKVQAFISKFLQESFNNAAADNELAKVINQDKDLHAKNAAIKEFNALKQRITEKIDITSKGQTIVGINYVKPNGNNTPANH